MPRKRSPLTNWSEYLAVRGIASFMQCFDVGQNLHTASLVGSAFYHGSARRRERAERNLALSFPEWPEERVRDVAHRSMQHMFKMFLVDALVMPRLITPDRWTDHVRLGPIDTALERLVRREPVIFVTGHGGNWELLGYLISVLGFRLSALARPLDNPLLNRWLMGIREACGLRIITKWGATSVVTDRLDEGLPIGFIADQNAGEQGLFVPFFGRLASSYKSIGLLGMRYRIPIITTYARRLDGAFRYEIGCSDCIRPEDWEDQPDPLFYITARFNRAMEQDIRVSPEQYLWIHRRWKSRPRHERQGRAMPAALRRKLEALPWLDGGAIERLERLSSDPTHQEVR